MLLRERRGTSTGSTIVGAAAAEVRGGSTSRQQAHWRVEDAAGPAARRAGRRVRRKTISSNQRIIIDTLLKVLIQLRARVRETYSCCSYDND